MKGVLEDADIEIESGKWIQLGKPGGEITFDRDQVQEATVTVAGTYESS